MLFPIRQSILQILRAACGQNVKKTGRERRRPDHQRRRQSVQILESRLLLAAVADFENFDSVTAPNLPADWTTSGTGTSNPWFTSVATSTSSPNSVFILDIATVSLTSLTSPIFVAPANGQIQFEHAFETEAEFDGGVLEISISGGAFTDILDAGGSFDFGGYNSTLSIAAQNPLPNRAAWSGNSGGFAFISTAANLPAAASGQAVQLRWRMGTDNSTAGTG